MWCTVLYRVHYVSKLKAIDTSEKDRALSDLDRTRAELREIDLRQEDYMNNQSFCLFASIPPLNSTPFLIFIPFLASLELGKAEPKRDGSQFFRRRIGHWTNIFRAGSTPD